MARLVHEKSCLFESSAPSQTLVLQKLGLPLVTGARKAATSSVFRDDGWVHAFLHHTMSYRIWTPLRISLPHPVECFQTRVCASIHRPLAAVLPEPCSERCNDSHNKHSLLLVYLACSGARFDSPGNCWDCAKEDQLPREALWIQTKSLDRTFQNNLLLVRLVVWHFQVHVAARAGSEPSAVRQQGMSQPSLRTIFFS